MANSIEVVVGAIGRAHGIRGDVAIDVRTDEPELRFAEGAVLRAEGTGRRFTVAMSREHSGRLLVHFEELADRTVAEAARGTVLVVDVDPAQLPPESDEFYDRQLVGLQAVAADGGVLGPVRSVLHLPLQDTLEIETGDGIRLVPFVTAVVTRVDLDAGRLYLADVPGLLTDLDEPDEDEPDEDEPEEHGAGPGTD